MGCFILLLTHKHRHTYWTVSTLALHNLWPRRLLFLSDSICSIVKSINTVVNITCIVCVSSPRLYGCVSSTRLGYVCRQHGIIILVVNTATFCVSSNSRYILYVIKHPLYSVCHQHGVMSIHNYYTFTVTLSYININSSMLYI